MNYVDIDVTHQPDERTRAALDELRSIVAEHYPDATFRITEEDDPDGFYLKATVDVEDIEEVEDLFIDRLIDMQVEEGLPIYVIVLEPLERALGRMKRTTLPTRDEMLDQL